MSNRNADRPRQRKRASLKADAERSLRRIVRGLRVASRRVEAASAISSAQLFVLQQLATAPPLSLRELADRTMTDRTSVAHVVERLEHNAYVERSRSQSYRRRYDVRITAKGRRLLGRAPVSPTWRLLEAMDQLSLAELHSLSSGLRRLAEVMGFAGGPAPLLFADTVEGARRPTGPIDAAKGRSNAVARGRRGSA